MECTVLHSFVFIQFLFRSNVALFSYRYVMWLYFGITLVKEGFTNIVIFVINTM